MKLFNELTFIAICPKCKCRLHYTSAINIYSGGPFKCGGCNTDVTKTIYGDKK